MISCDASFCKTPSSAERLLSRSVPFRDEFLRADDPCGAARIDLRRGILEPAPAVMKMTLVTITVDP